MKAERIFVFLCGVILLYCVSFPAARADEWNKKTTVTFSGPVDVSGHRLEAGTYVFKLADTVDRHVVQIFTGDEKQIIATILANPDYRVTPSDKTSIKFSETADDVATMQRDLPEAGIPIKEWFYPGDNFGQEFRVKPVAANSLASTLPATSAEATTIPAVSTDTDTPNVTPEAAAELLPSPEEKTVEPAEEKPVESAMVQPQQDPTPATSQDTKQPDSSPDKSEKTPSEMPQTASAVPLVGLLGLISVGVGLSLRQISKRVA